MYQNYSFCDSGLNVAEKTAIDANLIQTKLNENFETTKFWGKIFGIERDYYIIVATKTTHEIENKYFFSCDKGLTFAQLPIVEPWMNDKCINIASTFTGTPSYIYDIKSENGNDDNKENNDNVDENKNDDEKDTNDNNDDTNDVNNNNDFEPKKEYKLTELDRLAWTINKINSECIIVPKGSLRLTSKKIIENNPYFNGLSKYDSNKLNSYLHHRTPLNKLSISNFRKATAINTTDFLDNITDDIPKQSWVLRSKKSGLQVSIKNLFWPGFEFHYDITKNEYQQGYFGYGIRQNDLIFLI